ncbi:unnamed protein product [Moneuplotes crassus]|uniref:Uncharacterized protein n=1 Tax=Euplotes crassus TaxID=5936 RepID=A0AAD2D3S8_EUPCR|nr:unnamed protein product [Moneuplotes crassus]
MHDYGSFIPKCRMVDFDRYKRIDRGKKRLLFNTDYEAETPENHRYGYYFVESPLTKEEGKVTEKRRQSVPPRQNVESNRRNLQIDVEEKSISGNNYTFEQTENLKPKKKKLKRIVLRRISPEIYKGQMDHYSTLDNRDCSQKIMNSRSLSRKDSTSSHERNKSLDSSSLRRAGAESLLSSPEKEREKLQKLMMLRKGSYKETPLGQKIEVVNNSLRIPNYEPLGKNDSGGRYYKLPQRRHFENPYS